MGIFARTSNRTIGGPEPFKECAMLWLLGGDRSHERRGDYQDAKTGTG